MRNFPIKKIVFAVIVGVVAIVLVAMSFSAFETNKAGNYQVKQAFLSGNMTTRSTPGTYGQLFGDITTYEIAGDVFLSKEHATVVIQRQIKPAGSSSRTVSPTLTLWECMS